MASFNRLSVVFFITFLGLIASTSAQVCGNPPSAVLGSTERLRCNGDGVCENLVNGDFVATLDSETGDLQVWKTLSTTSHLHCQTDPFSSPGRYVFTNGFGTSAYAYSHMQLGGNLVTYKRTRQNDPFKQFSRLMTTPEGNVIRVHYKAAWATRTGGTRGLVAILQGDGRIAIVETSDCSVVKYVSCPVFPTASPSQSPTVSPTSSPTDEPSPMPTDSPTTASPSQSPTVSPTSSPTDEPSPIPTDSPTESPTKFEIECGTVLRTFNVDELRLFLSRSADLVLEGNELIMFKLIGLPLVKYGISVQKICASCMDFPGSCQPDAYGYHAKFSGAAMFPLTDNTATQQQEHVPGTHVGSLLMHGTNPSSSSSQSNRFADRQATSTESRLSLLGLLFASISASVTILPDGFGYDESSMEKENGVYRSYLVRDTYETSSMPLWYQAKKIVQEESDCKSAVADAVITTGYSEGGYAAVALSEAFRVRGDTEIVRVFSGAGPLKLSTEQLRFAIGSIQSNTFDPRRNFYIALLGTAFSSTNPKLPNYQAGQDFINESYRQVLVDVVNDGSPVEEIHAALPEDLFDVVDPDILDMYLTALEQGEMDPCSTSSVAGESDLICQAIQQQDLDAALENDVDYPVQICFGADDGTVTPNNVPDISLNPEFLTYSEKQGDHQGASFRCLFDAIIFYMEPENVESYPVIPLHKENGCSTEPSQSPTTSSPTVTPPTEEPTPSPTESPTTSPTTSFPSANPTTESPTTASPTDVPTDSPTASPTAEVGVSSPPMCGNPGSAVITSGSDLACDNNGVCESLYNGEYTATMDATTGNLQVRKILPNNGFQLHCQTYPFGGEARYVFDEGYGDASYARTVMGPAGNLVTYKRTDPDDETALGNVVLQGEDVFYKMSWASRTRHSGAVAILQDDGRIAIVRPTGCSVVDYVECHAATFANPKLFYTYNILSNSGPPNNPYSLEIHTPELFAMYPTVIKIPRWVPASQRVHPDAQYYMYSGQHHNKIEIYLSWASTLENMDVNTWRDSDVRPLSFINDRTRAPHWTHISSAEIYLDHEHQLFVMSFHGESENHAAYGDRHAQWLATSPFGLNFNDVDTGGGISTMNRFDGRPYGVVELPGFGINVDATARFANSYCRLFERRGRLYCATKRGELYRSRVDNPGTQRYEPYTAIDRSNQQWEEYPSGEIFGGVHPDPFLQASEYDRMSLNSRMSSFFGSREFAWHPNNPHPGHVMVGSKKDRTTRINRVGIAPLPGGEEGLFDVFFYAKTKKSTMFTDLYRFVFDCRSVNWRNWDVFRDDNGLAVFQVVVAAGDEVLNGYVPGDPFVFNDNDNGNQYLFFNYGPEGEGWITAVSLQSLE